MGDILIVDDERDIRELISEILQDEGFQNPGLRPIPIQAMAAVNSDPPALMILDIWLKDSKMDGIDILMSVKRSNPDIPHCHHLGPWQCGNRCRRGSSRALMISSKSPSTLTSCWW